MSATKICHELARRGVIDITIVRRFSGKISFWNFLSSRQREPRAGSPYNHPVSSDSAHSRRILGLDVGARRIGVAISDPLGITAQGIDTLHRKNKKYDLQHLNRVIREFEVQEIVVGLPLRMSGAEGIQAGKIQEFAEELRKRFKLPVHLWDERLTSAEANRLLRETDLSIEKRGKAVDRMAAILILQGWMDRRQT
jgi:putative holliday junction resolvase